MQSNLALAKRSRVDGVQHFGGLPFVLWLKSALVSLFAVLLIGGTVWLFWGDKIAAQARRMGITTAAQKTIPSKKIDSIKAKTAPIARGEKPTTAKQIKSKIPSAAPTAQAAAEWQKTQSGALAILQLQNAEVRRDMQHLTEHNDKRMQELIAMVSRRPTPPAR